jgi:hypothetical protein
MLRAIAQQEVGDRFGRVEPRANKRRPKAQRYLTERPGSKPGTKSSTEVGFPKIPVSSNVGGGL